jgi:hypothetical protein
MISDWIQLSATIITPIIAVGFSAWIISKHYYSQRKWEFKVSAYSDVLTALSRIGNDFEKNFEAAKKSKVLSEKTQEKLDQDSYEGEIEINRLAYLGGLGLRKEAVDELNKLKQELAQIRFTMYDASENFGHSYYAIDNAAKNISNIAKRDLQI